MAIENGGETSTRSTTDNIREVTEAAKQLYNAGEQLKENLGELKEKAQHATDVQYQLRERPWLLPIVAVSAGILGWLIFSRKR
jgi:Ser-tRNA(Ala) deacylase AlaX